jgi:hypothetical protein
LFDSSSSFLWTFADTLNFFKLHFKWFGQIWSGEYPDWYIYSMTNICQSTKWNLNDVQTRKTFNFHLYFSTLLTFYRHSIPYPPTRVCLNTSTNFQLVIDKWTRTVDFILKEISFQVTLPQKTHSTDNEFSYHRNFISRAPRTLVWNLFHPKKKTYQFSNKTQILLSKLVNRIRRHFSFFW